MSKRLLTQTYYYTKDGSADRIAHSLENCFEQHSYILLKNNKDIKTSLIHSYVTPLPFYVFEWPDGSIDMAVVSTECPVNCVRFNKVITETTEDKASVLERLLDKGNPVIVQTVVEKLRFTRFYREDFDMADFIPGHVFSILHYDKENFYYTEKPGNIKKRNFQSYKNRKDIGYIAREDMYAAFDDYLVAYTVEFIKDNSIHLTWRNMEMIRYSIDTYFNRIQPHYYYMNKKEKLTYFFGRKAILKCLDLSAKSGRFLLDKKTSKLSGVHNMELLRWQIKMLIGRKTLLVHWLRDMAFFSGTSVLVKALDASSRAWRNLSNYLVKSYFKKHYRFDGSYSPFLQKALDMEDIAFEKLDAFYERNEHLRYGSGQNREPAAAD
jgi:hypothetical protein